VGCLDGSLRVGARALRNLGDHLAGRRARGVEELAALRLRPLAVDEHPFLAGQLRVAVIFGEGDPHVAFVTGDGADQLLGKTGEQTLGAELDLAVVAAAAGDLVLAAAADDIGDDQIGDLGRTLDTLLVEEVDPARLSEAAADASLHAAVCRGGCAPHQTIISAKYSRTQSSGLSIALVTRVRPVATRWSVARSSATDPSVIS